jgi:prepilin-type N-terminal cleavage/methylation domain-containing protein
MMIHSKETKYIMNIISTNQKIGKRGFSLIEVVFASGILAVVFVATMGILQFHNIQTRRAMEQAMILDLCTHYLELARNQPFYNIEPGEPINTLYDGNHGAPNIRFPITYEWQDALTIDFRNFHPDIEWFEAQSPQYKCIITDEMVGDEIRSKHINFEVRWRPPLTDGDLWRSIQMESVVYREFN